MVLQRNSPIRVWGKAAPRELVTIKLGMQKISTRARIDGSWSIYLRPLPATSSCSMLIRGKNKLRFSDVQIGDVWLCSGQSNMLWPVKYSDCSKADFKNIDRLRLRIYLSGDREPKAGNDFGYDSKGLWKVITESSLDDLHMPAIPIWVAKELKKSQKIPIGMIMCARGAVPIETFLPPKTIARMNQAHFKPALMPPGVKPGENYQAMLEPLLKLNVSGILWYQGEGNYQTAASYRKLFPWFISDWRNNMANRHTPFYFIQIPNHGARVAEPCDSFWADLREAQTYALKLPNTHMIVAIDTVREHPAPLHPKEKKEIAQRLSNLVLSTQYRHTAKSVGPAYRTHRIVGKNILISFDRAENALEIRNGKNAQSFEIAEKDRIFRRATATIKGAEISVGAKQVFHPCAVRYAWEDNPVSSIYQNGLPLAPFRTDRWATHPKLNPEDWPKQ